MVATGPFAESAAIWSVDGAASQGRALLPIVYALTTWLFTPLKLTAYLQFGKRKVFMTLISLFRKSCSLPHTSEGMVKLA